MSASVLEEEHMTEIKRLVLEFLRKKLVENLYPDRFTTYLRSRFVMDEQDCDEIKESRTRTKAAEHFLDVLKRKGSRGYDEFCCALRDDGTQIFLLTHMNKTLELLKSYKREQVEQHRKQQQQASPHHRPHQLHYPPSYPQRHERIPRSPDREPYPQQAAVPQYGMKLHPNAYGHQVYPQNVVTYPVLQPNAYHQAENLFMEVPNVQYHSSPPMPNPDAYNTPFLFELDTDHRMQTQPFSMQPLGQACGQNGQ